MKKYLFCQLSEQAKQKAIEENREILVSDEWDIELVTELEEKLNQIGYGNVKISYSGFNSQGDGASFTYSYVDTKNKTLQALLFAGTSIDKNERQSLMNEITLSGIRMSNHYFHEKTITNNLEIFVDDWAEFCEMNPSYSKYTEEEIYELIEANVEKTQVALSKKIYSKLRNLYDSITDDGNVSEEINDRDLYFNEDGTKLTYDEDYLINRKYIVVDGSGRSAKPYNLTEKDIRKTWDLEETDEDDEQTLGEFLDDAEIDDSWTNGANTITLDKDLN